MLYKLQDFLNEVKYFFQRVIRGYADPDVWGLCETISKQTLPALKALRKNKFGYPSQLKSQKEWNKILDEIIWSMEAHLKDDDAFLYKNKMKGYKRMKNGFKLFGEHYLSLWD